MHGADQTTAVIAASEALFGQGELSGLDGRTLAAALSEVPRIQVAELGPVVDLFAEVGLVASKSAARRTVKEGSACVNNVKVTAEDADPPRRPAARSLAGTAPGQEEPGGGGGGGGLDTSPRGLDTGRRGPDTMRGAPLRGPAPSHLIDRASYRPVGFLPVAPQRHVRHVAEEDDDDRGHELEGVAAPSIPGVSATPTARAIALPTMAPRMPKMVVSHSGLCCLPGRIALASRPSTKPTMIAHNQPVCLLVRLYVSITPSLGVCAIRRMSGAAVRGTAHHVPQDGPRPGLEGDAAAA